MDETFWRTQIKDNFSIVAGAHTVKFGGEWMHSLNSQIFRGFFQGRYIFDSVTGFLRYASPAAAGGFGPDAVGCSNGTYVTAPAPCPAGTTATGGPLLLFLQGAGPPARRPTPPASPTSSNEDFALFAQDKWQIRPNFTLNYGLRWEAQIFPDPVVPPAQTAYGLFLNDPRFPSDGTLHSQKKMFQPRVGFAWDIGQQRQVGPARELRHLQRAAEHADAGRLDHHERRPAADDLPAARSPTSGVPARRGRDW